MKLTLSTETILARILRSELLNRKRARIQRPRSINIQNSQIRLNKARPTGLLRVPGSFSYARNGEDVIHPAKPLHGDLKGLLLRLPVTNIGLNSPRYLAFCVELLAGFLGPFEISIGYDDFHATGINLAACLAGVEKSACIYSPFADERRSEKPSDSAGTT